MQRKGTERALRDLFNKLQQRGEADMAAGVYLAAKGLYLPLTAWHSDAVTVKAVHRVLTGRVTS